MCAGIELYGNLLDESNTSEAEATESAPHGAVHSSDRNLQSTAVSNNELMPKEDTCEAEVRVLGVALDDAPDEAQVNAREWYDWRICENCKETAAVIFCNDCQSILCRDCSDTLHHDKELGTRVVPRIVVTDFTSAVEEKVAEEEVAEERVAEEEQYSEKSCCCLPLTNIFTRSAMNLIQAPSFDRLSMSVILLNCIALAMYNPADPDCDLDKCKILAHVDLAFSAFFTIECAIKVIAMGFCGEPGAYLSNG